MILGVVITSIGAGLLTMIDYSTSTVQWAAYMVINGLGIGMAQQLPYTALQAVLEFVSDSSFFLIYTNELQAQRRGDWQRYDEPFGDTWNRTDRVVI